MHIQSTLKLIVTPTASTKEACLLAFGGSCERCGYSKCLRALQFHHRDSSHKREWSKTGHASYSEIKAHPERFELLCANCHFEEHDAQDKASAIFVNCQKCGKEIRSAKHLINNGKGKYCSNLCKNRASVKPKPYTHQKKQTLSDRFWAKVNKTETCWNWTAYHMKGGIPLITVATENGNYRPQIAYRIAYEMEIGPIPKNQSVMQTCGNLSCVRPSHLALGRRVHTSSGNPIHPASHTTNIKIRKDSGMSLEIAAAIRKDYETSDCTQTDLAKKYKVSQSWVSQIIRNLKWQQSIIY